MNIFFSRKLVPIFSRIVTVLFVVVTILSIPTMSSVMLAQEVIVHVVKRGENLSRIAAIYGLSYVQLARYNKIANPNQLRVGQRLLIPSSASTSTRPTPTPQQRYVPLVETFPKAPTLVPPQGSLQVIALTPTRVVTSPPAAPARHGEVPYSVRRGDSLSGIAARYGVTVSALMRRNNLSSSFLIVGQRLIIPANIVVAPTPAQVATLPTPTVTPIVLTQDLDEPAEATEPVPARLPADDSGNSEVMVTPTAAATE